MEVAATVTCLTCRIELFGVPRLLAGTSAVPLDLPAAATLADAIEALAASSPPLIGRVVRQDRRSLTPGYVMCRDSREFLRDLDAPIQPGDCLLLFAAAAGGEA